MEGIVSHSCRRTKEVLNHYAQKSEAKTGRFGEKADPRLLPDVFLREPTVSGKRTRFLERFTKKLKALDGRMLLQAPSSQLIKTFTTMGLELNPPCPRGTKETPDTMYAVSTYAPLLTHTLQA